MGSTSDQPKDANGRIRRPGDRPRRRKRTVEAVELHVQELAALAQLMLGAAWSDGSKIAVETVAIAEQLKEFVDSPNLPEHVSQVMERFDPDKFDMAAACGRLRLSDDDDRVAVLSLLACVTGADRVLHPGEEAYLLKVAEMIGLDPSTVSIKLT